MKRYGKMLKIGKGESPFRSGSDYDRIFRLSREVIAPPDELIKVAARKLGKPVQRIKYDLYVLSEPGSRSNRMQCRQSEEFAKKGKLVFEEIEG